MIQKGDDLINGGNPNYQFAHINQNPTINESPAANVGSLTHAMSFEEYVPQQESTLLPSVETVLPQYIPTPPPSLPSPSVNMTTPQFQLNAPQFQLHHTNANTTTPIPQHNQNINSHHLQQEQQQQVAFHSSPIIHYNHMHNTTNIQSTCETQLLVDNNSSNYAVNGYVIRTNFEASQMPSHSHTLSQETVLHVSDTSTVDADETDNLNDEPFTYLQNLNSDNLMKFSQLLE